jgi:hypothetical protein
MGSLFLLGETPLFCNDTMSVWSILVKAEIIKIRLKRMIKALEMVV